MFGNIFRHNEKQKRFNRRPHNHLLIQYLPVVFCLLDFWRASCECLYVESNARDISIFTLFTAGNEVELFL